ncbi:TRAP transporter substrate-binding protein [Mangrovicoccus algicola]|uniref:TRAP transporter substrate-binding protein n=1 Tax=Mangrovicoccus algicola TaxID=2771008 RepID=A0A8J6ZAN0_9RHOB|nr:TRAP transporter substrate-binding protein [Mangrovicoccus algicola]MBE3639251.1 TRAP transporter substrate-binding protein [Mangrovicoccus algicola]
MYTKTRAWVGAAALCLLPAIPMAEELSFAHFVPPGHTITEAVITPFAEGIGGASDDALTVRVYPGGELGAGPLEQYVRVVQGVADIGWGLQGYTSSQFPKTMVAELPAVFGAGEPGYPGIWRAMDLIGQEYPGVKPLALWTSEPNIFIMKGHTIRRPEDVRGLKLRVSGAAAAEVIAALGATPVQMPANEMYNALQTGLIDGIITGSSAVSDFKLDEVADSYTLGAPLGRITFFVVMNQRRYDGLSAEERAAIDESSGAWLSQKAEAGWIATAERTIAALKASPDEAVTELSPQEAAAFEALTFPVTERLVEAAGAADVLAAMKGE